MNQPNKNKVGILSISFFCPFVYPPFCHNIRLCIVELKILMKKKNKNRMIKQEGIDSSMAHLFKASLAL